MQNSCNVTSIINLKINKIRNKAFILIRNMILFKLDNLAG